MKDSRRPAWRSDTCSRMEREHVEERPLFRRGKAHAAGRHHRHAEGVGQADEHVVVVFLLAPQVPLHFDVDVRAPEDAHQRVEQPPDAEAMGLQQRLSRHRDEPAHVPVEIRHGQRALAFPPSLKLRRTAVP